MAVRTPIQLDQFLKLSGAARSGGEAKHLVQAGAVRVNGQPETRRSHLLADGDLVEVAGRLYRVAPRMSARTAAPPPDPQGPAGSGR